MKNLTKIADLTREEVETIIKNAFDYKRKASQGIRKEEEHVGKVVAMIFEKPSLRTKVAFEIGTAYFGATPIFLSSHQILASGNNESGRETMTDIAKNIERYADLVFARVYKHETIQAIANAIQKPVMNGLCDQHHPTQALADLMTIRWHKGNAKVKVAFIGDGNNVATSLMQILAMMGMDFAIASPKGYEIPQREQAVAKKWAEQNGSVLEFCNEPREAVRGADIVYTDTFISMGQEAEKEERLKVFKDYQVNRTLMKGAKPKALFMHCLPAHRGEEVTDEVMDGSQSIVFDQAECRLHIAKALLHFYLSL